MLSRRRLFSLLGVTAAQVAIVPLLAKAAGARPDSRILYSNRMVRHWVDLKAIRDRNILLGVDAYAGPAIYRDTYRGIPIRLVED